MLNRERMVPWLCRPASATGSHLADAPTHRGLIWTWGLLRFYLPPQYCISPRPAQPYGDPVVLRSEFERLKPRPVEHILIKRLFDGERCKRFHLVVEWDERTVLRDVWMVQAGKNLRFTLESRQAIRIAGKCLGEDLQGDITIQLRISRLIDLSHAALANEGGYVVVPEPGTDV